jgi:hypothetical protein
MSATTARTLEGIARKIDAQRMPHDAAATIGPDDIADAKRLRRSANVDPHRYAFGMLLKALERPAEVRQMTKLDQPFAHHAFGQELGNH